jgi:hypothetical protein
MNGQVRVTHAEDTRNLGEAKEQLGTDSYREVAEDNAEYKS